MLKKYRFFSLMCVFLLSTTLVNGIITTNHGCSIETSVIKTSQSVEWFKQPQVYNMGAFSSEDIEKYHITVNGLWNGFIGDNLSSPFAFGRLLESFFNGQTFNSDKEFVEAQHARGVLVPATILTIQGHRSFQQEHFEEFACRSVNGELCYWDVDADSYWMNANNPSFIDWCIEHGKKAIDAGADMIVLDEIQGNSLAPMYQFASQYLRIPAPGFSNETIEGFRQYLFDKFTYQNLIELFDINNINTVDLKTRIASTMNLVYNERILEDPLIEEYQRYFEISNFEAKKRLILALRAYAEEKNKEIVITANSYALGNNQQFGFWPKGLLFADLLDMFTFENTYTAVSDQTIPKFYQTKWLAWERLAYAATNAPAVIIIDTSTLMAINENMFPLFGFSNSLGILCAEAYANKGSFVNYYFELFQRERNWNQVEKIQDFVMKNKEYYELDSEPLGDVGILYLYGEGMRDHMNTYLGCAQALAESHIPFEVIFDGDGFYLNASLSCDDLEEYPLIIIPSMIDVTAEQIHAVKTYVEQGGMAIVFDAESIGYPGESGELSYGDGLFYFYEEDICKQYFETYDDSKRQIISDCVRTYVDDTIILSKNDRKVIIAPYIQEENNRVILHMINYDHIGFFDFIWPQTDITIQLKLNDFSVSSMTLLTIDGNIEQLSYEVDQGYIQFTVPYLKDYAIICIQ